VTDPSGDWSGRALELEVGAPGHGGVCVAREAGRVVFVRHALPGERVRAVVTEDCGGSFCRADAVEVLHASPDRVVPPCRYAGPGRCGGCDWQHASGPAQRAIKAAVVREQFRRLAGLDVPLSAAEELPGGLLGWRTRVTYAVAPDGRIGLHRHRSHEIEPVTSCPLGTIPGTGVPPTSTDAAVSRGVTGIELAADDEGALAVLAHRPGPGRHPRGRRPPDRVEPVGGPSRLRHRVGGRTLEAAPTGFWQVHPLALAAFAAALLDAVAPRPGETVLDLYAGAGPLTSVLADAVGPTGRVVGVESAGQAVADARANLADRPWAEVIRGRVDPALLGRLDVRPDVVVLDPPRAGAGAGTMAAVLGLAPRCLGYVSCDPATLARDVRTALDAGWRLASLRAFDAFPMTHHVECLALLVPDTSAGTDTHTAHSP
jgi:tRNA/tmRNA/rRNA uracil-C5-methylase (TrmA/RlmC/RlmD family)